jgi:natural product precursor
MRKKIKLTDIHQNELQKDEMQSLFGGDKTNCKITCSCSCSCPINNEPESKQDQNNVNNTAYKIPGFLKAGLTDASGSIIKPGLH